MPAKDNGTSRRDFSLSIQETNKLRAQLGLAPLEEDTGPKADNWGDKKRDDAIKEKIEVAKKKREVYSKVLKSRGLADDSSDDEASGWVTKQRQLDEEKKKAEERAKALDALDEELADSGAIEGQSKKKKTGKKKPAGNAMTGGLTIGHSKDEFLSGQEQILVLEDKGVLDDGEEVLVNPNIVDKERTTRNVDLKKKRGAREYGDDLDEFGNPKEGMLSKYDEMDGPERTTFRLDDRGEVDIEKEKEEREMRQRLLMAGKILVNLDDSNKFTRASEFYTQEEMISFRKVKKEKKEKKLRKRGGKEKGGMLKADDLVPVEPAGGADRGSRSRRRHGSDDEEQMDTSVVKKEPKREARDGEDGEIETEMPDGATGKWKRTQQQQVDIDALKRIVEREMAEEDDESDDDIIPGINLDDVLIDDDAEDELQSMLEKARRLKQQPTRTAGARDIKVEVKEEPMEEGEQQMQADDDDGLVLIDSTMEYCRNIGEIRTHGIAGNRDDAIDYEEDEREAEEPQREEDEAEKKPDPLMAQKAEDEEIKRIRALKEKKRRQAAAAKESRGGWMEPTSTSALDAEDEAALRDVKGEWHGSESEGEADDEDREEEDVLGGEIDATKGVGAMLKLASKKGYLTDMGRSKTSGENLDHLKSRNFSKVDSGRFDIDEKYTKKLEKMGTTGRGPTMEFCEKKGYKPEVDISYVDNKGRELESKDAFRQLSWKFHGKMPGKKQQEKRARQIDQKELLKNYQSSSDTPLGTLARQRKKQEQLQTPYLVLSGNVNHAHFKKE
ncbi:unnamed protein product, partial [Mesorhabditis spiculigera]